MYCRKKKKAPSSHVVGMGLCARFDFRSGDKIELRCSLCIGSVLVPAHNSGIPCVWENPFRGRSSFSFTRVPVSATVALHSKVLHSLHGRMSSGSPQPYFVEILRRGDNPAAGGKRKPHLRHTRRWGWVYQHQGVERSVSIVCGIPCVWEKRRESQSRNVRGGGIPCVWEESKIRPNTIG